MEREEAGKEVESLMKDFGDNHIGQAYSSSSTPDKYSDGDTGGELHRVTWASSWYGYLQNKGFEASKAPVWDKPIWSTYDESTGKNNGFSMSLFEVGKIGLTAALTLTGAGAALGPVLVTLINTGVSVGHDLMNLAAGTLDSANFGLNTMKNLISGAAGMLTGGLSGGMGEFGGAMFNAGVNNVSSLATTGLHLNGNGQMDWSMTPTGWSQWGAGALANFGAAGLNSGLGLGRMAGGLGQSIAGGNQSWLGNTVGYGMQKATEGFVSSALNSAGNALASGMDWNSGKLNNFDMNWGSVWQSTAVAGISGLASGGFSASLGGTYDSKSGGMNFLDKYSSKATGKDVNLFYGGQINQVANTFGSILGETADFAMGNNFNLNLAPGVGLGFNHSGQAVRDDNGGGIGLDQLLQAGMNMNVVNFQSANLNKKDGEERMAYVNQLKISGDDKTAMDIINGKKDVVFLDEAAGFEDNAGAPEDKANWDKKVKTTKEEQYLLFFKRARVVEKRQYYNEKLDKAEWNANWDKAQKGDMEAFKKLSAGFHQWVTEGEDAVDKTQRAVEDIMDDAKKGKFGMDINGDDAKELKKILESGDKQKFEEFEKKMTDSRLAANGNDADQANVGGLKSYLNGLKYMYDNKDYGSLKISSASCAIIADYLQQGLTGKIDPKSLTYSDFYKQQFEQGNIGNKDSYTTAPNLVREFGLSSTPAYVSGKLDGKDVMVKYSPDLNGNTAGSYTYSGMTSDQLKARQDELKSQIDSATDDKTKKQLQNQWLEFDRFNQKLDNMNKQMQALQKANTQWYEVQRTDTTVPTHFLIMQKINNTYKLYDFNRAGNPRNDGWDWGDNFDYTSQYLKQYLH